MRLRMLTGMRRVDVEVGVGVMVGSRVGIRARVRCCQRREWRASCVVIQGIEGLGLDRRRREFRSALRVWRVWLEKRKTWLVTSEGEGTRAGDCGILPMARRAGLYSKWVPMDWFGGMDDRGSRIRVSPAAFSARSIGLRGRISETSRHSCPDMMVPMVAPSVTP